MNKVKLQQRNFLLLQNDEISETAKYILRSPLGLAEELTRFLFEKKYYELAEDLDKIKQFAAGIKRAKMLSNQYQLAKYYPTMLSFHQFFNSSFRARQGKVLEKILQEILKKYSDCTIVPSKVREMQKYVCESLKSELPNLDIDVFGKDEKNKKNIIVQLRSRDDTGETTAKGSLADFLRAMLRTGKTQAESFLYFIAIWDERNSQQKMSTIKKVFSSLKDYILIDEIGFAKNITKGLFITKNITLKLVYGTEEIANSIFEWDGKKHPKILKVIKKIENSVENWDDLWIAYAVSSLEIEINSFTEFNNVDLLEKHLKKLNIELNDDFNFEQIDDIALKLASMWQENSIPLRSTADRILYIRDLLFLQLIYLKLVQ